MTRRDFLFGDDALLKTCNIGVWLNWKEHAQLQRAVTLEKTNMSAKARSLLNRWAEVVIREHDER
jgi:hypothetical protein